MAVNMMLSQQTRPMAMASPSRAASRAVTPAVFGIQRPSLHVQDRMHAVASCRQLICAGAVLSQAPLRRQHIVAARSGQDQVEETQVDIEKIVDDLKERWENTNNKTSVVLYAVGAVVVLWLTTTVVGAVNNVPLLPKLLELVGLGYSAWFTYRYLLFKSSREELIEDVEELKKKITGAVEDNSS